MKHTKQNIVADGTFRQKGCHGSFSQFYHGCGPSHADQEGTTNFKSTLQRDNSAAGFKYPPPIMSEERLQAKLKTQPLSSREAPIGSRSILRQVA